VLRRQVSAVFSRPLIDATSCVQNGYYATGEREPNLATLVRICEVLATTPNDLLLAKGKPPAQSQRDRVLVRISVATDHLSVAELELAACQIECLTAHGPGRRRRVRGKAATG